MPQKKATGPTPLGCISDQDLLVLFSSPPNVRAKSVPKEVFVPPSENVSPQKKATGPTPLGCISDQDLLVLFSSPPNVRAKSVPKEVFVPPSENMSPSKNRAPKESNRTDATGVHFQSRLFFFFLVFPPNVRAKSTSKEVFVPPKRKLCPKRKQQDRHHGDAFAIKTFFGLYQ